LSEFEVSQVKLDRDFDLLALHRLNPKRYPYLLESVVHGTPQARYDILFAFPQSILAVDTEPFLEQFALEYESQRRSIAATDLPFDGGWFLYLAYELAGEIEPTLRLGQFDPAFPKAFAARMPAAVIRDHRDELIYLVAESQDYLAQLQADIDKIESLPPLTPPKIVAIDEDDPQRYVEGVNRVRDYIRDGDIFQANISRKWQVQLAQGDAVQLYRQLREHNPAPFAALVCHGESAIISSSPERLVDVVGDKVSTRPIAGTRPRGRDDQHDQDLSQTLLGHPKERAEHVMLIDLERNDLGRVCVPGTVKVDELMVLESYAHVHHIVSNVSGQLTPDTSPADIIRAVFPGGTITGCPKVRCMEIIHEFEQAPRGPYTGSLGYVSHCGRMDLNILIRTMQLTGNQLSFRTGAGIVFDSIAEREVAETRAKAKGMLRALGIDDDLG